MANGCLCSATWSCYEAQVADPGLVYVSDEDAALAVETRKRVLAELADDGTAMIAGHFAGVGRVIPSGRRFRPAAGGIAAAKNAALPVE